jgi:hypothetical protein
MTARDKTNRKQQKKQQKQRKKNQFRACFSIKSLNFRLLILKQEFLIVSARLHTEFAVELLLAERKLLEEQVNMLKLRVFRVGILRPIISRTERQNLVPL